MRVAKWGNSLAVRLPASIVKQLDLQAGEEIDVRVAEDGVLYIARKPEPAELLKRLRKFRGRLPKDFVFDRDEFHRRG